MENSKLEEKEIYEVDSKKYTDIENILNTEITKNAENIILISGNRNYIEICWVYVKCSGFQLMGNRMRPVEWSW